ncbi:hypothetical protein AB0G97_27465 [Streptomyces sp. NPDC020755]|uniref:hypothetical protein n=1 Tax=unclassified Streptomyces TaxID=2593676 RepID=UPI0022429067|nr:hypothetical protein [Streptomyces sp. VB1]UZI30201.1 hypothetical protein OH133_19885 [Streptomyces sp. VB1]
MIGRTGGARIRTLAVFQVTWRLGDPAQEEPDGNRGQVIAWLTRLCLQAYPDRWLHAYQGLRIELDTEPLKNWTR